MGLSIGVLRKTLWRGKEGSGQISSEVPRALERREGMRGNSVNEGVSKDLGLRPR